MPQYKLTYFDGRVRAETIRMTFAAAGVPFEDVRLQWPEWIKMKPDTPWGYLPVLEVDGQVVSQSMAIVRFIARETGLAGQTAWDQAMVDSVVDTITELREKSTPITFIKDQTEKDAKIEEFKVKDMSRILGNLEKFLSANRGGDKYFVGDSITWGDIHLFTISENLDQVVPDHMKDYPGLQALIQKVKDNANIAEYLRTRPQTQY